MSSLAANLMHMLHQKDVYAGFQYEGINDIIDYWKTLRPGGVMFGDDWSSYWPGVVNAVTRFSKEQDLSLHSEDVNWLLIKPA